MSRILAVSIAIMAVSIDAPALADGHGETTRSGEEIFTTYCANCHTGGITGFFYGAPDAEDSDDRQELAAKGLDVLIATTIAGSGDMAARGGCVDCTDEEIRNAIEYLLSYEE